MLSFYRYYRIEEKGPFAEYLNMQNDTEIEELVDSLSTLNHPILSLSPSVGRDLEIWTTILVLSWFSLISDPPFSFKNEVFV